MTKEKSSDFINSQAETPLGIVVRGMNADGNLHFLESSKVWKTFSPIFIVGRKSLPDGMFAVMLNVNR